MKKSTGLWIDHREAVIVFFSSEGESVKVIRSKVEKHAGHISGAHSPASFESQLVPKDDSRQRAFTGYLNIYYDEVIAVIRNFESIFIFGPGEAKGELKKRIEESKSIQSQIEIEAVGKMTQHQISAKVRGHFKNSVKHLTT